MLVGPDSGVILVRHAGLFSSMELVSIFAKTKTIGLPSDRNELVCGNKFIVCCSFI